MSNRNGRLTIEVIDEDGKLEALLDQARAKLQKEIVRHCDTLVHASPLVHVRGKRVTNKLLVQTVLKFYLEPPAPPAGE